MNKKRIVIGVLAHVDSGKTTLSEAILYLSGEIRTLGRVDHKDAYLDTNQIERERGITIFSKQAVFSFNNSLFTLLDTPGHIDFSTETERALSVLDYAILLISASDGVQSHTLSLWKVLEKYNIPTFIFINKMDMPITDKNTLLKEVKEKLSQSCTDFTDISSDMEGTALLDETLMEEYLQNGFFSDTALANAINSRKLFPCFFGSALKTNGVNEFLAALDRYTIMPDYKKEFGGKVYKISTDEKGQRITHLKLTGGVLKVKDLINEEKVNEIRIYSGDKYESVKEVYPGTVCTVSGLTNSFSGQGLGFENDSSSLIFEPVFSYKIKFEDNYDINMSLKNLRKLEEENSQLNILWNEQLSEIHIQLMGEVQCEVLKRIIKERFDMNVSFEKGGIIYKETIENTVVGVGHYEPLRHYSEVQLLLEPGKRGTDIILKNDCSEEELDKNWQRLIMTHLEEKTHLGVLTGFPVTDIKITLLTGKAHKKHTEGGDFRQATYRAVRQGLMQAKSILLEPWYNFTITLPSSSLGRAMTDIQNMGGKFNVPETDGGTSVIKGSAPVIGLCDYQSELRSYTHGMGFLECTPHGYEPCENQDKIVEEIGYDPKKDTENSPDSIFCSHGAGFLVKWDEVHNYMHTENKFKKEVEEEISTPLTQQRKSFSATDEELLKIFEMTYGKIKRKSHNHLASQKLPESVKVKYCSTCSKKTEGEYLLVDGYNILFSWFDLKNAKGDDLEYAREYLINRLSNYKVMQNFEIIIVFDAYKVKNNPGSTEKIGNVTVVYTKEAETADHYIEKFAKKAVKNYKVRVATSDRLEQLIIFGGGAFRISAEEFLKEIEMTEDKIDELISNLNTEQKNKFNDGINLDN